MNISRSIYMLIPFFHTNYLKLKILIQRNNQHMDWNFVIFEADNV